MTQRRSPFRCFKTSPEIIRVTVMLYIRFPLSLRNVEDLLHERGIEVSHEAVRLQWLRFGPMLAAEIRNRLVNGMRSSRWRWHLDEVLVRVNGVQHDLWRAVDHEGEVLEAYVTKRRDKAAALKFLRKLMKRHGRAEGSVTDRLRSHGAAPHGLGADGDLRRTDRWADSRAETSHQPFRRRGEGDAARQADARPAEARSRPLLRAQPPRRRPQPHQPRPPQAAPHRRPRRVAGALRGLTSRAPAGSEARSRSSDGTSDFQEAAQLEA